MFLEANFPFFNEFSISPVLKKIQQIILILKWLHQNVFKCLLFLTEFWDRELHPDTFKTLKVSQLAKIAPVEGRPHPNLKGVFSRATGRFTFLPKELMGHSMESSQAERVLSGLCSSRKDTGVAVALGKYSQEIIY